MVVSCDHTEVSDTAITQQSFEQFPILYECDSGTVSDPEPFFRLWFIFGPNSNCQLRFGIGEAMS